MGRNAHANYIEAALTVLRELGGGPISTKTLVTVAHERGLVGDGDWVYHNFSRRIRKSELFDTSVRGQISLVQDEDPTIEVDKHIPTAVTEEVLDSEPEEQLSLGENF